ncbi:MAG TPA: hypothetical protein VEF04_09470, partial [Blastocatellia bacterium]|nr:hypothetical protein [Blastocatellia bacterium]
MFVTELKQKIFCPPRHTKKSRNENLCFVNLSVTSWEKHFLKSLSLSFITLILMSSIAQATTLYYGIGVDGIMLMNRSTGAGTLILSTSPFPAGSNAAALAIQQTSGDLYWVQYATSSGSGSLYRWNPGTGGSPTLITTIPQSSTGSSVIVRMAF